MMGSHVPSIPHLSQVGEYGQVLLLMYRIIECWITMRYFSFFLFYRLGVFCCNVLCLIVSHGSFLCSNRNMLKPQLCFDVHLLYYLSC